MKNKCKRCRLQKCFQSGMNTDYLVRQQDKQFKQQAIKQNRLKKISSDFENDQQILTDIHRTCLSYIRSSYLTAIRSIPPASSIISFKPSLNQTYSFYECTQLEHFTTVKLIHFLRLMPEFECVNSQDRLSLVKYNLLPLIVLSDALAYDRTKDIYYDINGNSIRTKDDEQLAYGCRALYVLFYGSEETKTYTSNIRLILDSVDNDPMIIHLLMLVLIFLKGVSINDEQLWSINDCQHVFQAHSKYVELLFRYLISKYSYSKAILRMTDIVYNIFRIQTAARFYQQLVRIRAETNDIHPLIKSVLCLP